jgi:hypothetical protein
MRRLRMSFAIEGAVCLIAAASRRQLVRTPSPSDADDTPSFRETEPPMRLLPVLAATTVLGLLAAGAGHAQDKPQKLDLDKIDVVHVDQGERASKIIGKDVFNDAHQDLGKIDDVIVTDHGKSDVVVLAVGGFVGGGAKLVAFPYQALTVYEGQLLLSGASQNALKALPAFQYATK